MPHICVKIRIQTIQKHYAISLTNGRSDLTTENHWIKKFHWRKEIKIFKYKYILTEYKYIFFEWQNSYKTKIFFSLNVNIYSFLDKKTLNIKRYFCNISASIAKLSNILSIALLKLLFAEMIDCIDIQLFLRHPIRKLLTLIN